MKIFTNKNLIQKVVIVFLCVFLLNFCMTPSVQASFGGSLFTPMKEFITAVADIFITLVQWGITGNWIPAVDDRAGTPVIMENIESGSNEGWHDGTNVTWNPLTWANWLKNSAIDYPVIQISPELIFGNRIRLLDIDFIGNQDEDKFDINSGNKIVVGDGDVVTALRKIIASWYVTLRTIAIVGLLSVLLYIGIRIMISSTAADKSKYKQMILDWIVAFCLLLFMHYIMAGTINIVGRIDNLLSANIGEGIDLDPQYGNVTYSANISHKDNDNQTMAQTTLGGIGDVFLTPNTGYQTVLGVIESLQCVRIDGKETTLMDAVMKEKVKIDRSNINISDEESKNGIYTINYLGTENSKLSITFSLVASEGQGDKIYVYRINSSISNSNNDSVEFFDDGEFGLEAYKKWYTDKLTEKGIVYSADEVGGSKGTTTIEKAIRTETSDGDSVIVSDKAMTDGSNILYYINYARLYIGLEDPATSFGFIILYIILIVLTTMFAIRYMKRVIYVAFLTLIAPLVALTYPIDKLKDGQAQAFNMWFKEYIFNVLIQPFHLLIYTILVGSAMELASQHMIYAIVAIGFLIPAEKLLRKFFGFDKAGTLSAAGSFAGGAIFSSVLNKINRPKPGGKGGSGSSGEKSVGTRKPGDAKLNSRDILMDRMADQTPLNGANGGNAASGDDNDGSSESRTERHGNQPDGAQDHDSNEDEETETKKLTDPVFKRGDKWALAQKNLSQRLSNVAYSKYYRTKATLRNKAKTLPRMARRIAIGGTVGGGLALAGLAVGAASGDPSKAFSLAAAGGAAGYYGSNYYGDKLAKAAGNSWQSSKVNFWGSDIKAIEQAQFDKEFYRNPNNRDTLVRALGSPGKVQSAIKDGSIQAFLNKGITDPAKIGKSLALLNKGKVKSLEEAVAVAQWNRDLGPAIFDPSSEHRRNYIDRTLKELKKRSSDPSTFNEDTARARIEDVLDNINYLNI